MMMAKARTTHSASIPTWALMTGSGRRRSCWAAHNDLAKAEDVPESRGLRDRALGHVDTAHQVVDRQADCALGVDCLAIVQEGVR